MISETGNVSTDSRGLNSSMPLNLFEFVIILIDKWLIDCIHLSDKNRKKKLLLEDEEKLSLFHSLYIGSIMVEITIRPRAEEFF